MRTALARALSVDDVNRLGRVTGQSERLRVVTPHRLFLAIVSALASADVESLADLLREFNHQNNVTVAYKAFYNRLARAGFAAFMKQMFARLLGQLSTPNAAWLTATARYTVLPYHAVAYGPPPHPKTSHLWTFVQSWQRK